MGGTGEPAVSFVIPARNEAAYLPATLESIRQLEASLGYECIVVDGQSEDETPEIAREYGARVVAGNGTGQGEDRHLGAESAAGRWLAFIDADTRLSDAYLDRMLSFVTDHGLQGASSRCRVSGGWRTVPIERLFNHVLPRLSPPPFPGFNVFVDREAYFDVGGFTTGPNEDMAFSRALGKRYPTGVCPAVLVETSGRRIERDGLLRTLVYYTKLEYQRQFQPLLDRL
ncbi:glycosyltransferase [Halohasta litorea]|uniref:Glycosyltransferase n=1 Tax=Halohasta litorea TaxID=869891 RepID=A0ABD6D5J8_9EURY|nr:glycosyltransferase [Halohasta litorea]